jgi:membrane protein DedA with SNARE-associated domain
MFESLFSTLQDSSFSLWGPFLLLLLCGMGFPIPEDIVLIIAGMLAQDDGRSWISAACLMYLGVLMGDTIIFMFGRHLGRRLLAWKITHLLFPPRKQARVSHLFRRYGSIVLLIARFLPGLRAPIFCSAGAMRMGYLRFLLADGAAALLSVPVFVWLGHWLWGKFNDDVKRLNAALSQTHRYSIGLAVIIVLGLLLVWWIHSRSRKPSTPRDVLPPPCL